MKDKKVLRLDVTALLSGAMFRGQFEERLQGVIKEVQDQAGKVILFIDEIHTVVGAGRSGGEGAMDMANILKPALARGELQLLGATTLDEYRSIEKDAALARRFQSVYVKEPDVEDTLSILRGLKVSTAPCRPCVVVFGHQELFLPIIKHCFPNEMTIHQSSAGTDILRNRINMSCIMLEFVFKMKLSLRRQHLAIVT